MTSTKINLKTKQKSMKACARKKRVKVADELIQREQRYSVDVCPTCKRVNPPKVEKVPLKEEEHTSWLEFKKLDKGKRVHTGLATTKLAKEQRWSINVDHPFVSVVRDFATNAFNAVVHMYFKKNNSIRHSEVTSCVYDNNHYFYLTMEAIEEGTLGVYDVVVACNRTDGSISLVRLKLTDDRPTGKIAMMLPQLISLRSEYETMKGMEQDLKTKLKNTQKSIEGKENKERVHLKEEHRAIKEKCKTLYQHIQSQIPKTWIERRGHSPASCGHNSFTTGLTARRGRREGLTYSTLPAGFDYCTRSLDFPLYIKWGCLPWSY